MFYLLDEVLEIAKKHEEDENACALLEGACEMGVVEIHDEEINETIRGINVFLGTDNTGEEPAFVQVGIDETGNIVIDEGMPKKFAKDMLEDQVAQAKERAQFCEELLEKLKKKRATKKKRKYTDGA